jgi:hypothetical protein
MRRANISRERLSGGLGMMVSVMTCCSPKETHDFPGRPFLSEASSSTSGQHPSPGRPKWVTDQSEKFLAPGEVFAPPRHFRADGNSSKAVGLVAWEHTDCWLPPN